MHAPSQWSNSWYPSRRGHALNVTPAPRLASASQTPGHLMFGREALMLPACRAIAGQVPPSCRPPTFGPHNPGCTSPAQTATTIWAAVGFEPLPGSGEPATALPEPRHASATRHATESLTIGMLAPHPAARGRDHPLYP